MPRKRPEVDSGARIAEALRAIPLPGEPPEAARAAATLEDDGPPSPPAWPPPSTEAARIHA